MLCGQSWSDCGHDSPVTWNPGGQQGMGKKPYRENKRTPGGQGSANCPSHRACHQSAGKNITNPPVLQFADPLGGARTLLVQEQTTQLENSPVPPRVSTEKSNLGACYSPVLPEKLELSLS